jgi:7,8-dihydropterin-6-yl-methyl-4-(beta-D-ribofuranosyl)aminobenzene 5'-phosphate synthase
LLFVYIVKLLLNKLHRRSTIKQCQLFSGIWLIPVVIHTAALPYKDRTLFVEKDGRMVPDDFTHECVLAVKTEKDGSSGFALFNSCSHNGVVNSLESVRKFFPHIPILSYTGGFHFPWNKGEQPAPEDISGMNELAVYTAAAGIELYSGHCTGAAALDCLENACGSH